MHIGVESTQACTKTVKKLHRSLKGVSRAEINNTAINKFEKKGKTIQFQGSFSHNRLCPYVAEWQIQVQADRLLLKVRQYGYSLILSSHFCDDVNLIGHVFSLMVCDLHQLHQINKRKRLYTIAWDSADTKCSVQPRPEHFTVIGKCTRTPVHIMPEVKAFLLGGLN